MNTKEEEDGTIEALHEALVRVFKARGKEAKYWVAWPNTPTLMVDDHDIWHDTWEHGIRWYPDNYSNHTTSCPHNFEYQISVDVSRKATPEEHADAIEYLLTYMPLINEMEERVYKETYT